MNGKANNERRNTFPSKVQGIELTPDSGVRQMLTQLDKAGINTQR